MKKDKKKLKEKIKLLNFHITDLKHGVETIESFKNIEILKLQGSYDELFDKYKNEKIALKRVKTAHFHEIAKKLKEFILRYY